MAASIPQAFIDDLLERTDIVDVVDSRVKLKKAGKNYSACCPFHDEKTPSFTVSQDKQFFYCFGCGATGNAVGFIMDYERISFPEAIESLAKTAGVEVPREQNPNPEKRAQEASKEKSRKTLYKLMGSANDYYQQQLRIHASKATAINYLKNRGLSGHIAKDFGIGYAPPGWNNLLKELAKTNESQDLLLEGGMLVHNEEKDSLYDRFRERITFPIRDIRGRVIGFGGRVLNDEKPKYLNSPETPIFHKGKELYGLYEARQAYRQLPRLLIVEGYMDVVALAQYGIRYGAATLGTACGENHLNQAFRYTNEVVFCFDGDNAGRKAAKRAMENALTTMKDGRQIKFLYLPEGEDPDTLIRQVGTDKFTRLIESASPLEHFLFEELSQDINTQTMEGRARLCKLAAPLIDQLPRGVYRELMFGQLANRTQLSVDALINLLDELSSNSTPASPRREDPSPQNQSARPKLSTNLPQDNVKPKTTNSSLEPATNTRSNHITEEPYETGTHYKPHELDTNYTPTHAIARGMLKTQGKKATYLNTEELALTLLLYKPQLAQNTGNIDVLRHSQKDNIRLLVDLIELLQQRADFSSSQILGHWQGTYGTTSTELLQQLLSKADLFHHAHGLATNEEKQLFKPQQEFLDTLQKLTAQQEQQDCNLIVEQLNNKPPEQWTETEKQLYRKAIMAMSNEN